ncbi:src kinase-associated phosphoprotein 2-B-like isoform X1 [Dreissena polymorpha]|uniref:src kinase-associated phosphoprotein 2-B-like isoform X1 n=1 Tax=Dreissena polymorpha TaxID=45954 RepID=UPI002265291F|nr:src kinase-associated phosphoprotein 2-B-like isoform X1 [Dreissena polymorpha]
MTDENLKQLLYEVEKFLNETLKKEKLGKKSQEHKQIILDKLTKLYEENPNWVPTQNSDGSGKDDDSTMTGGSNKSDEGDTNSYSGYIEGKRETETNLGIGLIAAGDIKEPLVAGFLDKKQKKGTGLFGPKLQTRYCVISGGVFYYYEKQTDKKQCGAFKLDGYKFRNNPEISTKKNLKELCFEVYHSDENKRLYQFITKTKPEYEQWEMFISSQGQPLIEEDMYEEVGNELKEKVLSDKPLPSGPEEDYVDDVSVITPPGPSEPSEDYEEPEAPSRPPPPPISTLKHAPPISTPKHLPPLPPPPEPELIQEDIYDDTVSPQTVSPQPAPPPVPPPIIRKAPPQRVLPECPPQKVKINVKVTCNPKEDFENLYYGKWDCNADNKNELSFKRGDMVYVISRQFDEKAWWICECHGKYGLVPKSFLLPAYTSVD